MKLYLCLITTFVVAISLFSCKAKKAIVTESIKAVEYADTTKISKNLTKQTHEITDTTKTAAGYENRGEVEFIEGGGKVTIDSVGNMVLEGVKAIRGHGKGAMIQATGIAEKKDSIAGHREQYNGISGGRTEATEQTDTKPAQPKWYETMFMRIGLGVCIAALVWLFFLYLKRKF